MIRYARVVYVLAYTHANASSVYTCNVALGALLEPRERAAAPRAEGETESPMTRYTAPNNKVTRKQRR